MLPDVIVHRVFVDFENVPTLDLGLVAGIPVHVTVLIGRNQTKLTTSFSLQLHRHAAQVHPVEVGGSGRNALDLTLACYLGQAVHQWPEAQFHIVSRDRDFEPMIAHLATRGVQIARVDDFHLLPFLVRPVPAAASRKGASVRNAVAARSAGDDRRGRVIARLTNPANRNRPSTRKALLAHLKTAFGKESSDATVADCLAELQRKRVLAIDGNDRVTWR